MRTRFSVSARWAFSCASWECKWAYCLVLLEEEEEDWKEEEEWGLVVLVLVAGAWELGLVVWVNEEEGLVVCLWAVEGAILKALNQREVLDFGETCSGLGWKSKRVLREGRCST